MTFPQEDGRSFDDISLLDIHRVFRDRQRPSSDGLSIKYKVEIATISGFRMLLAGVGVGDQNVL